MPQCARHRMSNHHIFVFCVGLFIAMGVITCGFRASNNALHAAPLTFRFDGEISRVSLGSPFALPFEFRQGDAINGKITFEPGPGVVMNDVAVAAEQPLPFEFNIDGVRLLTLGYRIVAFDDSFAYDSERPPYDGLALGCQEASCTPDIVSLPGSEPFKVRWEMRLTGSSSTWSTPQIFGDVNFWNALTDERRIQVNFDNVGPGSVGFDAVLRSMVQVPEPGFVSSLVFTTAIYSSFYRRTGRRRRTNQ